MRDLVIEHFGGGDPAPVDRRSRPRGRLAPEGLAYVNSWVTHDLRHCDQIMGCADRSLLDAWTSQWSDLVDFEVVPVVASVEAAARVSGV